MNDAKGRDQGEEEEEEDKEDEYLCTVCNEEPKIKVVRDPGSPTPEEREKHDMTHSPYRSWCPICVEAKGKEDPHLREHGEKRVGVNVIGMDYKTFGQDDTDEKMTKYVVL